ncbi:MAG: hypothetical protein K0U93_05175 [Gammaproteobacteria bacterium]|nr:hypothetical protein [Gammaproteobacteria bacterium]
MIRGELLEKIYLAQAPEGMLSHPECVTYHEDHMLSGEPRDNGSAAVNCFSVGVGKNLLKHQ